MKFLFSIFLALFAIAQEIEIINGKKDKFSEKNIYILKCSNTKDPFDNKVHYFCGTTLKNFVQNVCKKKNIIKFVAYDDYETTFTIKEINDESIILAFQSDNRQIPPRIVYTKKNYPQTTIYKKSIFLIQKAVCK
ncbi:hypothetical protein [Caminibacter pacificus]